MNELARKGLERLRERFVRIEDQGITLACLLVEREAADEPRSDDVPPVDQKFFRSSHARDRCYSFCGDPYRRPYCPSSSNNFPFFTDQPSIVGGKPVTNTAGQPLAFVPALEREINYEGSAGADETFNRLSREAADCFYGLPNHILRLFPIRVRQSRAALLWTYTVFECAWIKPEGSSLPDATRQAWKDQVSIPLDFPNDLTWPTIAKAIPRNRWYALIDDLFSASRATIDLLLHVWDSVPDGWLGLYAPKDIHGLRRFLSDALEEVGRRSAASPQFAAATPKTEFNGIPAHSWWPYIEFCHAQVRTAVIATDNAAAWMRANGQETELPPPIDFSTSIDKALKTLKDWSQLVEAAAERAKTPKPNTPAETEQVEADDEGQDDGESVDPMERACDPLTPLQTRIVEHLWPRKYATRFDTLAEKCWPNSTATDDAIERALKRVNQAWAQLIPQDNWYASLTIEISTAKRSARLVRQGQNSGQK